MILEPSAQSCYWHNYYHQLLSLPSPSEFWTPFNIPFLYPIVSTYLEFLMPYNLNFHVITSPVSWVESPGKQTLRWWLTGQEFMRECSWDSHLWKAKETGRNTCGEKLSCSAVLTCMTYSFAGGFPDFSFCPWDSLYPRQTGTVGHPSTDKSLSQLHRSLWSWDDTPNFPKQPLEMGFPGKDHA